MIFRICFSGLLLLSSFNALAFAACLDVFPSGYNHANTTDQQLSNFPTNSSGSYINDGQVLPRGDNLYLGSLLGNGDSITVSADDSIEKTARLFFRDSVSWQNVSINAAGNPEDLIIVVDGSLFIDGGSTLINAIIYVKGSVNITGAASINGAIASVGGGSGGANYDGDSILEADFNGMCDQTPSIPISCDADLPAIAFSDDFSSVDGGWQATNFDRARSNWPGDTIYNSSSENQNVVFSITGGQLRINGSVTLGGDNEYGAVRYDLSSAQIDKTTVDKYTIDADFEANKINTNNDTGIVFGFVDDRNYYAARWTKYGTAYQNNNSFPGVYRRLELIKMSNGIVSTVAYKDGFDTDDPFNLEVVVNEQGTAVCVDDAPTLYSASEQPLLNDIGILSYDNDDGVEVNQLTLRCDDCELVSPIANYQFDECSYSDVSNEVIDQTGTYPATPFNGVANILDGKIERAAELTDAEHHFQTNINLTGNFTVSTWFKKPTSNSGNRYFVLGAFEAGGDLLYLDRESSWRWGVYNVNTGSIDGTYSFASLDDNWHHLVLVYQSGETLMYMDGIYIETIAVSPSGSLKYIGTSLDEINGASPQGFRAPLDEFMVFNSAMSANNINVMYNNQNGQRNYDGTTRATAECGILHAAFRFDEPEWNGTAQEVIDETGNFHANSVNGASTSSLLPALSGDPGTCGYGVFDGVNDYVELPGTFDNLQSSFTITAWIYPENLDSGSRIFLDDEKNQGGFGFSLSDGSSGSGHLRFYSRRVSPIIVDTADNTIAANEWAFVSVVHDSVNKTRQIFVNGVAQVITGGSTVSTYTGNWGTDSGPSTIGGETDSGETGNRFTGAIDEVQVYLGALSEAEIQQIYAQRHACPLPIIDHFEIEHDGNGLTCLPETVTIKACTNADCSIVDSNTSNVILTLTSPINGTIEQAVEVTGATSIDFRNLNPETVMLALKNETYQCKNGGSTSCDVVFSQAGFVLENSAGPNVKACTANTLTIKAVKLSDDGVNCAPLFTGNQNINVGFNYVDPLTGSKTPTLNSLPMPISGQTEVRTVFFDNNGSADLPLQYDDAGQFNLTVSPDTNNGIVAGTIAQTSYPGKFAISSLINGSDVNSITTQKASVDFSLNVAAQCNDASNTLTPNYQPQTTTSTEVLVRREGPIGVGTVSGIFILKSGVSAITAVESAGFISKNLTSAFSGGEINSSTASYSEVGLLSIDIRDTNYFGNVIEADAIPLGRFIPDHFKQTVVEHGTISANHGVTCLAESWVYSGQTVVQSGVTKGSVEYNVAPEIIITAYNADDVVTQNYIGDFAKLSGFPSAPNSITLGDAVTLHANALPITSDVTASGSIAEDGAGVLTYTFSNEHHFTFTRSAASEVSPFIANFEIPVTQVIDSDGVVATELSNPTFSAGVEVRFGRAVLENTYGPETSNLPQVLSNEYLLNGSFVTNTNDNCAVFNSTNLGITAGTISPANPASNTVSGSLSQGFTRAMHLLSPGVGNQGTINVEYTPSPWLLYDWDKTDLDTTPVQNPTAVATFGLYRGNDRIIYYREIQN